MSSRYRRHRSQAGPQANGTRLDRRTALLGGVAAAAAVAFPAAARAARPAKGRMQDLTHTFTAGFPVFT